MTPNCAREEYSDSWLLWIRQSRVYRRTMMVVVPPLLLMRVWVPCCPCCCFSMMSEIRSIATFHRSGCCHTCCWRGDIVRLVWCCRCRATIAMRMIWTTGILNWVWIWVCWWWHHGTTFFDCWVMMKTMMRICISSSMICTSIKMFTSIKIVVVVVAAPPMLMGEGCCCCRCHFFVVCWRRWSRNTIPIMRGWMIPQWLTSSDVRLVVVGVVATIVLREVVGPLRSCPCRCSCCCWLCDWMIPPWLSFIRLWWWTDSFDVSSNIIALVGVPSPGTSFFIFRQYYRKPHLGYHVCHGRSLESLATVNLARSSIRGSAEAEVWQS